MKAIEAQMLAQIVSVTETQREQIARLLTIARLARKHHRLAETACNGEGAVNGRWYRLDGSTPDAYPVPDVSVFDLATEKVEAQIQNLVALLGEGWRVEFQGDPRGWTVKVYHENRLLNLEPR